MEDDLLVDTARYEEKTKTATVMEEPSDGWTSWEAETRKKIDIFGVWNG